MDIQISKSFLSFRRCLSWNLLCQEKDDVEARLRDLNEMCEKASSQQSSLQQELERTRQQANEALRSMDVERQQLRTANNK